jgi:glycosyltransferase involved in cell wall biosynthesis
MKILYVIDHLRADGTQQTLLQLATGLAKRGHHQAIISLLDSWDEPLLSQLRDTGTCVRILGLWHVASAIGLLPTWNWMRRERFDAAVTLLLVADVLGRPLARAAGIPVIVSSLRARNVHYKAWQRWLVRTTMRWVDAVVLNSTAGREFAVNQEGAQAQRVHVIPNGVEVDQYQHPITRSKLCAEFGLATNGRIVGSAGRLAPQKGFDVLLDALSLLGRTDVQLLLFGRGKEEAHLRTKAVRLGPERYIRLAGYRDDLPRLLGALDLYVQPSRFEGMPHAVLEAMAAGCPIVATSVDGIRDLIQDGCHGWLVPPDDATALAAAMNAALGDPREARRRGAAAQARARADFGTEAIDSAWEGLLQRLAEAKDRHGP